MSIHYLSENELDGDLKHAAIFSSWDAIESMGQGIRLAIEQSDWKRAGILANDRQLIIEQHFERHPVGPDSKHFYINRIGHFLRQEEQLKNLLNSKRRGHLRLVK